MTGPTTRSRRRSAGIGSAFGILAVPALMIASLSGPLALAQPLAPEGWQPVNTESPRAFSAGERLEFEVHSSRFGRMGSGLMRVEGPVDVRGHSALLLSMDVEGRVFLFGFEDHTRSWFDPVSGSSLRFHKKERHPLARRSESVELLPSEGRWEDDEGNGGELASAAPLDELSVIYFLRTLEPDAGAVLEMDRHFDEERNPIRVRWMGRETITVPAGTFDATVVELEVRDPRRYDDEVNTIRIHFTQDERRLPLRIESEAPRVGTLVMTLGRWSAGNE